MMKNKITSLTLDFSKWRSGDFGPNTTGDGPTLLLNDRGQSCCLGQFCMQLGVVKERLLGMGEPEQILIEVPPFNKKDVYGDFWNGALSDDCIGINDQIGTTPDEKIRMLTERLNAEGIELIVINKP